MNAAQRMEEYLKSVINSKEKEIDLLGGELSALRSSFAALQQFRDQEKKQETR